MFNLYIKNFCITRKISFLLGTPALTSRQFIEDDFVRVVEFLNRGIEIAIEAKKYTGRYSSAKYCII